MSRLPSKDEVPGGKLDPAFLGKFSLLSNKLGTHGLVLIKLKLCRDSEEFSFQHPSQCEPQLEEYSKPFGKNFSAACCGLESLVFGQK